MEMLDKGYVEMYDLNPELRKIEKKERHKKVVKAAKE